jgi:outer membrane protein OmpA-like peptidoglycan-associated protein
MEERRPTPPRNPSRTLAIAAVAVLVVIAIAGIVLAGLRGRGAPADGRAGADATQAAAPAMTAAVSSGIGAADAGPNQIVFPAASDQLSEAASTKLVKFAESLKKDNRLVVIATKIEARQDRNEQMELAKKRAYAVRQVLEGRGIALATMRIEITELPKGLVTARDGNLVEVVLR